MNSLASLELLLEGMQNTRNDLDKHIVDVKRDIANAKAAAKGYPAPRTRVRVMDLDGSTQPFMVGFIRNYVFVDNPNHKEMCIVSGVVRLPIFFAFGTSYKLGWRTLTLPIKEIQVIEERS